jgi:hypothetical protein
MLLAGMRIINMKPSEIIKQDAINNGWDPKVALLTVNHVIQNKMGFILTSGDTVLLLIALRPHVYEVHLASLDKPLTLAKSMLKIFNKIKKLKIKAIYGAASNPQIIILLKNLAKHEGENFDRPDMPDYNWMIKL